MSAHRPRENDSSCTRTCRTNAGPDRVKGPPKTWHAWASQQGNNIGVYMRKVLLVQVCSCEILQMRSLLAVLCSAADVKYVCTVKHFNTRVRSNDCDAPCCLILRLLILAHWAGAAAVGALLRRGRHCEPQALSPSHRPGCRSCICHTEALIRYILGVRGGATWLSNAKQSNERHPVELLWLALPKR